MFLVIFVAYPFHCVDSVLFRILILPWRFATGSIVI